MRSVSSDATSRVPPICMRDWWTPPLAEMHYYTDNLLGDRWRTAGQSDRTVADGYDFYHRKSMVGRDETPERVERDRMWLMPAHAKDRTWHRLGGRDLLTGALLWIRTARCGLTGASGTVEPCMMRSRYEWHAAPFPAQTRWGP